MYPQEKSFARWIEKKTFGRRQHFISKKKLLQRIAGNRKRRLEDDNRRKSNKLGIDEETLFRLSEGFGAGMADMQGTCGAATGMYMIAGALGSSGAIEKGMTKGRTYQTVKGLTAAFDEKNGSHICKELKGIETGKVLRSCDGCIEDAVRIAERLFS